MSKVFVISPSGQKGSVPQEQLEGALKAGYQLDEVRNAASEDTGAALITSFGRGLTLGISDYLSLPGGPQLQAAKKAVREENPVASVAGELAGTVLNPLARIAAGATTVRGAVALGSIEGGLFGLGSALTEDALGDPEALSEQLAARVGGGALAGGALSGAFQKVLGGAERLALSEQAATLPKVLTEFSEKASSTIRKSSITDDVALRKAGISWDDLNKWGKDEGLFNRATSPEALFQQADVAAKAADDLAGAAALKLDELGKPNLEKLAQVAGKLADDETLSLVSPGLASKARSTRKMLEGGSDPGVGSAVEQTFSWGELSKVLRAFDEKPSTQPLADALRDVAMAQAKKLDPGAAAALERGFKGRVYANFLKKELSGADSNIDWGSVASNAALAGVWGGPGAAVGAATTQVVGRVVQSRGPFVIPNLLDKLPDASVLKPLAESFLVQLRARLNTAPELLGPFRVALENAAAGGAAEALATHLQLSQGPNGDEYLSTLGLVREAPGDIEPLAKKAETLSALMKMQTSIKSRIEEVVGALDKDGGASPESVRDFQSAYDAVQKLVKQPPVDDKLGMLPATQMGLTAKLSQAAQHVWAAAPKDPHETLPPAIRPPWEPTAMEQQRFLARAQAAFEPLSAIEAIMRGEPAQERLATLAALYPRLMEQTTEKLFERLNSDKPLSWKQRQRLTPILGPEAVGLTPAQVALIASVHTQSVEGPAAGAPRVNGRQVVDQQRNMQTQSQRIEARRNT